ncbi:MAG: hypothetical protein WEF53_11965 [Bacteroidota bacterium]
MRCMVAAAVPSQDTVEDKAGARSLVAGALVRESTEETTNLHEIRRKLDHLGARTFAGNDGGSD